MGCCSSDPEPEAQELLRDCCHSPSGDEPEPGVADDEQHWNRTWLKLAVALVLAGQGMIFSLGLNIADPPLSPDATSYWVLHGLLLASALAVMALLGRPLFKETLRTLWQRRITVESLFTLSLLGALIGSLVTSLSGTGSVYYEVVAIVLCIYTVGKTLGTRSRSRALREVRRFRQRYDQATLLTCCGQRKTVSIREVESGDRVLVGPGEPITVDGCIEEGTAFVVETSMTGEPVPVKREVGDAVLAGSHSLDGTLIIRTTASLGQRKLDRVLETVEQASLAPSRLQEQADRMIRWFVPLVVAVSLATFAGWFFYVSWTEALFNSMAVLLVACPCALGLATPIAIWSGLVQLSRLGLIARSGEFLDTLARADVWVFDKTGTLSTTELQLVKQETLPGWEGTGSELRQLVDALERNNAHPYAKVLSAWAEQDSEGGDGFTSLELTEIRQEPGVGVRARWRRGQDGRTLKVVLGELVKDGGAGEWGDISLPPEIPGQHRVFLSLEGRPVAVWSFREKLRDDTLTTLKAMKVRGLQPAILTGDLQPAWKALDEVEIRAGLSPLDKLAAVEAWKDSGHTVIFVGDGINDAAAMARADASIAMGEGADLARASSTAVLNGHYLSGLVKAVDLSRRVRQSVRGNILFASVYNMIGMGLAAAGMLHPVVAALLMLVSSFLVSFRAIRSAGSGSGSE